MHACVLHLISVVLSYITSVIITVFAESAEVSLNAIERFGL